jgi:hypothetical protein
MAIVYYPLALATYTKFFIAPADSKTLKPTSLAGFPVSNHPAGMSYPIGLFRPPHTPLYGLTADRPLNVSLHAIVGVGSQNRLRALAFGTHATISIQEAAHDVNPVTHRALNRRIISVDVFKLALGVNGSSHRFNLREIPLSEVNWTGVSLRIFRIA